jgi:Cu/Ag efflux protein CusF
VNSKPPRLAARAGWALACFAASAVAQAADPAPHPDPLEAAAPVPPLIYRSELPGTRGQYLRETDPNPLPWRKLFEADGRFATEPMPQSGGSAAMAPSTSEPAPPTALPAGASDARAVVKSIDLAQGKVKLKHGPIPRLDMPGMTMVFRVKDPRLLETVQKGEEVGFTLEIDGNVFYVTGFQE